MAKKLDPSDFSLFSLHSGHKHQTGGRMIMKNILSKLKYCNVILYASPGKEGFYQKFGFRKMKTGMAQFIKSESMQERGFTE
jgi:hypothetical protein